MQTWNELHITSTSEEAEHISSLLTEFGASAVTFRDGGNHPIFEPTQETQRIWPKTIVVGLFDETIDIKPVLSLLNNYDVETFEIKDEDWVRRSLDSFKPMSFGKKLWVCPSWQKPPDPTAINLILDPGLAFGTGSHPTTALCLAWLDENINIIQEATIIDYGCGSGILGIAALKLGAKRVYAVDNDPQALRSSEDNRQQNNIQHSVFTTHLPEDVPNVQADIVMANILAQPLTELAPTLAFLTRPGGKILISGVLSDQAEDINNAYKHWYTMQQPVFRGEWVKLVGIRANNI